MQFASFEHIRRPSSLVCIDLPAVKAVAAYLCSQSQRGSPRPSPLIGQNPWPQGCFAGFFIKTLGMGTAMFPQMSVGWCQAKAVTSAPFHRLEVILEWAVRIWKGLTPHMLFRTGARGQMVVGMWGWEWIMFPNQQGRVEANWGSVAGKSSHSHICNTKLQKQRQIIYIFSSPSFWHRIGLNSNFESYHNIVQCSSPAFCLTKTSS